MCRADRQVPDAQALLDSQTDPGAASIDLDPIIGAAACFLSAATANAAAVAEALDVGVDEAVTSDLSRRQAFMERSLLGDGLPDRPFFRHNLVAPGFYTGYDPTSLPGFTYALGEGDMRMAEEQVSAITTAIFSAARCLSLGICPINLPMQPVIPLTSADLNDVCGTFTDPITAIVDLSVIGGQGITGVVVLTQVDAERLEIVYDIQGLSAGMHGFHVHDEADFTDGCSSTGSHYNPAGFSHAGPSAVERHVGDLGNIIAVSGRAAGTLLDTVAKLYGPASILGRAIVLHADADDLGLGGHSDSLTTGHAGGRLACGAIVDGAPLDTSSAADCAAPICPGSPAEMHAGVIMAAVFEESCDVVEAELVARLFGTAGWVDPHNRGAYSLTSRSAGMLRGQRVTGDGTNYTDKVVLQLSDLSQGSGAWSVDPDLTASPHGCRLQGCSESQGRSYGDYSTNFCNIRNLYCGDADGCAEAEHGLTLRRETMCTLMQGASDDVSQCTTAHHPVEVGVLGQRVGEVQLEVQAEAEVHIEAEGPDHNEEPEEHEVAGGTSTATVGGAAAAAAALLVAVCAACKCCRRKKPASDLVKIPMADSPERSGLLARE